MPKPRRVQGPSCARLRSLALNLFADRSGLLSTGGAGKQLSITSASNGMGGAEGIKLRASTLPVASEVSGDGSSGQKKRHKEGKRQLSGRQLELSMAVQETLIPLRIFLEQHYVPVLLAFNVLLSSSAEMSETTGEMCAVGKIIRKSKKFENECESSCYRQIENLNCLLEDFIKLELPKKFKFMNKTLASRNLKSEKCAKKFEQQLGRTWKENLAQKYSEMLNELRVAEEKIRRISTQFVTDGVEEQQGKLRDLVKTINDIKRRRSIPVQSAEAESTPHLAPSDAAEGNSESTGQGEQPSVEEEPPATLHGESCCRCPVM